MLITRKNGRMENGKSALTPENVVDDGEAHHQTGHGDVGDGEAENENKKR